MLEFSDNRLPPQARKAKKKNFPLAHWQEICGVAYVPDPEAPGELIVQLAICEVLLSTHV